MPGGALALLAPGGEFGEIRGACGGIDSLRHREERFEHALCITHDRDVRNHVLANLGGININVHDLCGRGEGAHISSDAIVIAHPNANE